MQFTPEFTVLTYNPQGSNNDRIIVILMQSALLFMLSTTVLYKMDVIPFFSRLRKDLESLKISDLVITF